MEDGKAIPLHAKRVVSLPRNNEKIDNVKIKNKSKI